jgi:energy-coupling factor transporter ATP-binding protein EcfA2
LIVGSSNRRAVECIQRSLRRRAVVPPTLLIGPSGVGKSHLVQAAANRWAKRGKRVLALRAHEFRERYVDCIRAGTISELRSWLRAHDALVVDELEDLITDDATLDELAALVVELIKARRRVYLATVKLWPSLFDVLAQWDADVVPVERPSLAQRATVVLQRGRRQLSRAKLVDIARSATTIPGAFAALERELLATECGGVSAASA